MYATPDDMLERYSRLTLSKLTNKENDFSSDIDNCVLLAALATASSMIDGYLAVRYTLPLSTESLMLVQCCCVITRYNLESGVATDQATEQYKSAVKWLQDVSRGVVQLGPGIDGEVPDSSDTALMESAGSVWARHRAKGFI
ncbi:gp436 family protein [Citrobacter braakii]|uniref:gp436 family protein n=1 Tax=Citrobacter braakii TaxID=57706 RepID=UPI00403A4B85